MVAQVYPEFLFDPALAAQLDVRDAGTTGDSAAEASGSTQAAIPKQIEALQRELAAVRASDGEPRSSGVITILGLAAPPAALDDYWRFRGPTEADPASTLVQFHLPE